MDTRIPKPLSRRVLSPVPENRIAGVYAGLRRRSKSVADLKSLKENNPSSKYHPIASSSNGLTKKVITKKGDTKNKSTPTKKILDKKSTTIRRKSKTVIDINKIKASIIKAPPSVMSKTTSNKSLKPGQKRTANNKLEEVVKPKVSRKIPEWDYKSRFAVLNEKYIALQSNYEKSSQELLDLKETKGHIVQLSEENNQLKAQNNNFKSRINILEEINMQYEELKENYNSLCSQHKETKKHLKNAEIERDESNERYRLLEDRCKEFERQIKELQEEVTILKADVLNYEELRRKLHNTIQDLKGNIRVFCRVRPPVTLSEENKLPINIDYTDEQTLEIRPSKQSVGVNGKMSDIKSEFQFDKVFPPKSTQSEIFKELAQLVQSALDGYNICVFAYGQTGSGKTYTMQGENIEEKLGMIPRTIDLIFSSIEKLKFTGWIYKIKACFLEIYNETIVDLLDPTNKNSKDIRYNDGKGTTVTNLTEKTIKCVNELKRYMLIAHKNRATACTEANQRSSRSHAITRIYLEGVHESSQTILNGSINLVDLAGSENASNSNLSIRLAETKNINKSLSNLGNVMLALHRKEAHIPYRNCKLTYLLQPCLGGNSKSLMFVNISPFEECYNETINSLRFAQTVKDVKMSVKRNKTCF